MDVTKLYKEWLTKSVENPQVYEELVSIQNNPKEIEDSVCGGLRVCAPCAAVALEIIIDKVVHPKGRIVFGDVCPEYASVIRAVSSYTDRQ